MKIIFSRKGFDSSYGKMPSPILPDGTIMSFPIPSDGTGARRLASIRLNPKYDHIKIAEDLSNGRITGDTTVHMDPDLSADTLPRIDSWRPTFGQVSSAQGHLKKMGVGTGDLFLFFGWFRQVGQHAGKWIFVPDAPNLHVLFGWMQIGEIIEAGSSPESLIGRDYPWLKDHPHAHTGYPASNTIYAASRGLYHGKRLMLTGTIGAGLFGKFHRNLQLTTPSKPGARYNRSHWTLPESFFKNGRSKLSYHLDVIPRISFGEASFEVVARGQEFIYPCDENDSDVIDWAMSLITRYSTK
ncbi:hypothetical protein HF285_01035 [Acidithiobacillus ferrooxidans F221]|uniref:Nmad3 family putative nucleotide modification protein n=1 Tax=Acidithiobacillus ferrooxidans TaxID=920 RepID=UPI001C06F3C9|nr:hypothetical protein [Acidithiobacillus ferrooxidans]MBU2806903.1 hypothetical protein [Acidithiobacillus ferrooxidans F221]